MTKAIIATTICAMMLLTSHLDADETVTGVELAGKTPNVANKHPDLHQTLADGTFDSMSFERQIVFLHEPYFRDLAEFGLDTDAIDREREFIAEMAGKLAKAAEAGASVFEDGYFQPKIIEMHAAMFVANDRTLALPNRAASPQEAVRERRHVMDLQRRMLVDYERTLAMAQDISERVGLEPRDGLPPPPGEAQANDAGVPPYDEARFQERFNHHRKTRAWTPARVARSVVRRLGNYAAFSEQDRVLVQSIDDLDRDTIGRQAVDPIIQQLCALPTSDVRGRARLMNEAIRAESTALDAATDELLGQLTPDGSKRMEALVQSASAGRSSAETDWEGIATDLPQFMEGMAEGACQAYDLMIGVEAVLEKGEG